MAICLKDFQTWIISHFQKNPSINDFRKKWQSLINATFFFGCKWRGSFNWAHFISPDQKSEIEIFHSFLHFEREFWFFSTCCKNKKCFFSWSLTFRFFTFPKKYKSCFKSSKFTFSGLPWFGSPENVNFELLKAKFMVFWKKWKAKC